MTYFRVMNSKIEVYKEVVDGGEELNLLYAGDEVRDVLRFKSGNIAVIGRTYLTLISESIVRTINKFIEIMYSDEIIILVEKRGNTVVSAVIDESLEVRFNMYLVDNKYWGFVTNLVQLAIPIDILEVTGFKDNNIYGYRKGKKVLFDLDARTFKNTKEEYCNIVDMLKEQ